MTTIDKRVVQMAFDNDQFEKGVGTSIKSIDNLKRGLNFDNVHKSMYNLGDAFQSFGYAGQKAFGNLANGIGAWEVIVSVALGNIVSKAIDAGSALMKSLTIEPISLGFADYGRKLTSIQTITNATGKSIEQVDVYFGQLDEYADKTIYNLDDMTGAMAKFVNAGVDLDKAVPAIKGISNMTALAGQDANAAKIAYYNLSQSIAGGFLTTMDYKSLNLANIATKEWKDTVIAAAVAAGTLKKGQDGLFYTPNAKKGITDTQLFTEGLSEQWATTDVLLKVLGDYGDTTTEIGKKAQSAAQDVKSWSMMMETLKASVGTGWTDTFEIMIGDLDEAKALFTPLTETIQGLLNITTDARNNLLQGFVDLGGRTAIIDTVKNAFSDLKDIMKPVFEAFRKIFPPITAKKLFEIVNGLKELTEKFKMGSESSAKLKKVFLAIFGIVDILRMALVASAKAFGKFVESLKPAMGSLTDLVLAIADWIIGLRKAIKQGDTFTVFYEKVAKVLTTVVAGITAFIKSLTEGLSKGLSSADKKVKGSALPAFLDELSEKLKGLGKIGEFFSKIFAIVSKVAKKFGPVIKAVATKVGELVNSALDAMTRGLDKLDANKILDSFNKVFAGGLLVAVTGFVNNAKKLLGTGMFAGILLSIKSFIDSGGSILTGVAGIFESVRGSLDAYQKTLKSNTLMKIAQAVGLLVLSIIALTLVDQGKLVNAIAAISGMFVALTTTLDVFDKTTGGGKKMAILALSLIAISGALFILAGAIALISLLDPGKTAQGVIAVGSVLGMLLAFQKYASNSGGLAGAATQMLGLSLALLGINLAIRSFGSMDPEALGQGLLGMGGALALVGIAMKEMTAGMTGAASLVVAAAGLLVLAGALKIMGSMPLDQLGVALLAIAGVLTILGIAGYLLTPAAPVIATIAVSLLAIGAAAFLFGLAIGAVGAGLGSLALGIVALAGLSSAGIAAITLVIGGLAALVPMIATQIVKGITAFLLELYKSIPKIAKALVGVGLELLKGFSTMIPEVVETILTLIGTLLTKLEEHIPSFVTTGYELLKGILTGIRDNIGDVTEIVMEIIREFMDSVTLELPSLIDSAYAMILSFINGLADGVDKYLPEIMTATSRLGMAIINGLVEGWGGGKKEVKKGMKELGNTIIKAFKEALGIHSPSQEFNDLGVMTIEGFIIGINDKIEDLKKKMVELVSAMTEKIRGMITKFKENGRNVISGLITGLLEMRQSVINTIKGIIDNLLPALHSKYEAFKTAGTEMITRLITAFNDLKASVANKVAEIIDGGLATLRSWIVKFSLAGIDIITSLISGFNGLKASLGDKALELIEGALKAITDKIGPFFNTGWALVEKLRDGVAGAIYLVTAKAREIIDDAKAALYSKIGDFLTVGWDIVAGIRDGIGAAIYIAVNKAYELANSVLDIIKDVLNINSPSRETKSMGKSIVEGLALGMNDNAKIAQLASENLGNRALDGLSKVMKRISDGILDNIDPNPTIRPVVDLSDVMRGSRQIDRMLANKKLNVAVSASKANDIATRQDQMSAATPQGVSETSTKPASISFVQNNISPKALTRVEIYRQTRNQISALKQITGGI